MKSSKKVNPYARHKARKLAVQALYQWQISQNVLADILAQYRLDQEFPKSDGDYFEELLKKVVELHSELDQIITPYLDRKLAEVDPIELAILRLSTYELIYRIDIPYKVVINEGVELAKVFGATDSHKYINGILDKASQNIRQSEIK